MEEYWFDFRFFVKAETYHEASEKIIKYLPESTEDIWYTIDTSNVNEELRRSKESANK